MLAGEGGASSGTGGGGGGGSTNGDRRALVSATITLTLAVLGSSVLPLPYAISRLGIVPGLGIMLVVAASNALAGTLLLRAAGSLDKHSFEGLAEAVGGRPWRLFTEVCLILLLFGNLCGDLCLLADMGVIAAQELFPGGPPAWMVAGDGRLTMVALTLLVVFPLSCLRRMRELEQAAMAGVVFVVGLAGVFVYYAVQAGLPAVASGELPLWRPAVAENLPEAVGVLSFAFYLTPLLFPLLREMPPGKLGVKLTCRAVQIVTIGVAYCTYAVIGFFAAARYGLATEGDVIVNYWLPGRWDGALSTCMLIYLAVSMAPMTMTLRVQLFNLLMGEDASPPRQQEVAMTAACLLGPLLVALPFPTEAEKMFAVTGATAVCAVCYLLPVAIHLRLYLRSTASSYSLPSLGGRRRRHGRGASKGARGSFSFDGPRLGSVLATAAGTAGQHLAGEGGPDTRWLLAADHLADTASTLGPGQAHAQAQTNPAAAALAALQQQQQQQQGEAAGFAEWDEDAEAGAVAAGLLGGHQFTDLSLDRWLTGRSCDSLGGASLPATPKSPGSRHRDSHDSLREGSTDSRLHGWGSCGGAGGLTAEEAQQHLAAGGAPFWDEGLYQRGGFCGSNCSPELTVGLAAVPESAAVVPGPGPAHRGSSCAGIYPCWSHAGSGRGGAALQLLWHVVVPSTVALLGVASSVSALWLAVAALH